MTFIKKIEQNSFDSHQASPGYVLTCLRWSNRDTFNYTGDALDVRKPLVIVNDAIQVSTGNTKKGLSNSMTAVLKGGDLNYATALNPGDFIMVNLLNWEKDVWRVANKARALSPINRQNDGFKGVFKIQTVRKNIRVNPEGIKTVTYTIHASGFTEFNNVIMYNPALQAEFRKQGITLNSMAIGEFYQDQLKTNFDCQTIVKDLFKILIGKSNKDKSGKIKNYGNTHFRVPKSMGQLLGRDMKYATDMFNYIVGIWKASKDGVSKTLSSGMNPNMKSSTEDSPNFFETGIPIQGNKQISLENWNNNQAWSIIQSNINSTMNEMYTATRIDKNGAVMPTVVVRQKPFTTPHFKKPDGFSVTRFFELPRWKISSNLILDMDLGKNEAARFNFVQVFTRSMPGVVAHGHDLQIAQGNFHADQDDVERSGLRPYVQTANFDFPLDNAGTDEGGRLKAKEWSEIVSDWIIDGHLKVSGTIRFKGIQHPIEVGDNIEIDGIILHIESVSHTMSISGDKKNFSTTVTVSYGMDVRSNKIRPVYAEMEHTDAHTKNIEDYRGERLLPGISDTQLSLGRDKTDGEEINNTKQESFTGGAKVRAKVLVADNTGEVLKPDKDDGEIA